METIKNLETYFAYQQNGDNLPTGKLKACINSENLESLSFGTGKNSPLVSIAENSPEEADCTKLLGTTSSEICEKTKKYHFNGTANIVQEFIGRQKELEIITKALQERKPFVNNVINVAITGMGGVGKTELARKFLAEQNECRAVCVNAKKQENLDSFFRNLAQTIDRRSCQTLPKAILPYQTLRTVYRYLSQQHTIIVFDDAGEVTDPDGIACLTWLTNMQRCAEGREGSREIFIIVISRCTAWQNLATVNVHLDTFCDKEAMDYIYISFANFKQITEEQCRVLANKLSGHPLALRLAVCFIKKDMKNKRSLSDVLEFLNCVAPVEMSGSSRTKLTDFARANQFVTAMVSIILSKLFADPSYGQVAFDLLQRIDKCTEFSDPSQMFNCGNGSSNIIPILQEFGLLSSGIKLKRGTCCGEIRKPSKPAAKFYNVCKPVEFFCGRGKELLELKTAFDSANNSEFLISAAIVGSGRIGKKELLRMYIKQNQNAFNAFVWIDAENPSTLWNSFRRIRNALGLESCKIEEPKPNATAKDFKEIYTAFKEKTLFIFSDVPHPKDVEVAGIDYDFIPLLPSVSGIHRTENCHVAITTRKVDDSWPIGSVIQLGPLQEKEAERSIKKIRKISI